MEKENKENAVLAKNKKGYGYTYTDLAEINNFVGESGFSYYQEIESDERGDFVVTHILKDGGEVRKVRGARIVDVGTKGANAAQQLGSAITYARRYSLLLAFGLATDDDDAACLSPRNAQQAQTSAPQRSERKLTDEDKRKIIAMEIKNIMDAAQFTEAEKTKFRDMLKGGTPIDAVRSLVEQAAQDKAIIAEAENGN